MSSSVGSGCGTADSGGALGGFGVPREVLGIPWGIWGARGGSRGAKGCFEGAREVLRVPGQDSGVLGVILGCWGRFLG